MFAKKNKRAAPPKGQGASTAKQMGLFLDFNPEDMMQDMSENMDDSDLEAEFAAIVGKKPAAVAKKPAKAPLPMEDIAKMTQECMKDIDDDEEDEDLEDNEDLLAELQEVVGEEELEDSGAETATSPGTEDTHQTKTEPQGVNVCEAVAGSIEHTLQERISMYKTAINNATTAGESAKARRYDRGLKTLLSMLKTVQKGGKINEAEIPPLVASGNPSDVFHPVAPPSTTLSTPDQESDSAMETSPITPELTSVSMQQGVKEVETMLISLEPPAATTDLTTGSKPFCASSTETEKHMTAITQSPPAQEKNGGGVAEFSAVIESWPSKEVLLQRQKEYKIAALKAKQAGDVEQAKVHMRSSKSLNAVIEALEKGETVDFSKLPPPLSKAAVVKSVPPSAPMKVSQSAPNMQVQDAPVNQPGPAQPKSILEALEQRMSKYKETCDQAKGNGDERKVRMYDRIVKQYQSAIRAHKAGRAVSYDELPVPPGFPPMPGQEAVKSEQGLVAALEAANKLTSNDAEVGEDDEEGDEEEKGTKESKTKEAEKQKRPTVVVLPMVQTPSPSSERITTENHPGVATEQVKMLEGRKKQYMKAALEAKQKNDLEQAKLYLRTAKSIDPLINAALSGKPFNITQVPSPPGDEVEDFIMVHHTDVKISEKADEVYAQLTKMLKQQYEKCQTYSKQFTHNGNVAETTKFEKMAEKCKKSLEIVKLSQDQGLEPPKHHFEERTYHIVRIFPELSSTDMVVLIVRGMNLPAPQGVSSNDLDAYVKFEFPYPSSEQPQKHKTMVIKNNNSPEFNKSFTLNINRNHRGFRRVVQTKGLKLEIFHKGGFLRSDKPVGTAHVKLEKLETESEVREIVEVMDGRKSTGGRLEVKVRLREPLNGQDMQTTTERWLVMDQTQVLL